jgi:hypothetical protein
MSNFDQDQQLFHAGDNVTVSSDVGVTLSLRVT